jgi:hypothetical protein
MAGISDLPDRINALRLFAGSRLAWSGLNTRTGRHARKSPPRQRRSGRIVSSTDPFKRVNLSKFLSIDTRMKSVRVSLRSFVDRHLLRIGMLVVKIDGSADQARG